MSHAEVVNDHILTTVAHYAEAESPREACGWITAHGMVYNAQNVAGSEHAANVFGETECTPTFEMSSRDILRLASEVENEDPAVIVYHSHPGGVGAYFSERDTLAGLDEFGTPRVPVDQLVLGLDHSGRSYEAALFVATHGSFAECCRWHRGAAGWAIHGRNHPSLNGILGNISECDGPTPLLDASGLLTVADCRLLIKLESENPTGSHKWRAAKSSMDFYERCGLLVRGSGQRLIAPTGGNYGRAVATLAAERGYSATFTVPDNYPTSRLRILEQLGATVELSNGTIDNSHAKCAAKLQLRDMDALFLNQFGDPTNIYGHMTTGHEILAATGKGPIDYLVAGIGSGAHITGIGRALRNRHPSLTIVGVQPAGSDVLNEVFGEFMIPGLAVGLCPPNLDRSLISLMTEVTEDEVIAATSIAGRVGLSPGPSSAANIAVAWRIAQQATKPLTIITIVYDDLISYV